MTAKLYKFNPSKKGTDALVCVFENNHEMERVARILLSFGKKRDYGARPEYDSLYIIRDTFFSERAPKGHHTFIGNWRVNETKNQE